MMMMRYLNKVVFINSAHIPYAEVKIDGNVHFIGTQGVGKSTILRAILFFYNADSTKLGISKEKKTFFEYYFPYDDSYVIYEVKTESHFYCVCAYKANGRICFKFLNTHFERSNFIDKSGNAYAEWKDINQVIDANVHITRRVDKYEEYRDIIFGNNKSLSVEFKKFALLNSSSYRNIPRTIQNVFLNSKLEAEFIKQTIIMSMNEEETAIDLSKYSRHIDRFQQQLSDISKWRQTDKQSGKNEIRFLADKVVGHWRSGKSLNKQCIDIASQLNFSYRKAQEQLPLQQHRLDEMEFDMRVKYDKLKDLGERFRNRADKLNKVITINSERISVANKKTTYYEVKGIRTIIEKVARKGEIESAKYNLEQKLSILLSETEHINSKFEQLLQQEDIAHASLINIKNNSKVELMASLNESISDIEKQYADIIEELRVQGEKSKDELRDKISFLQSEISNLLVRRNTASMTQFFEEEITDCKKSIEELSEKKKDARRECDADSGTISTLRLNWDTELKLIDGRFESDNKDIKRKSDEATERIARIEDILLNMKGSFCEWLNAEYPDWGNSIGKVIDEENILFSRSLSPKRVSSENTLFGIQINLDGIDKSVKSIKDYELEITNLIKLKKDYSLAVKSLLEDVQSKKDHLHQKYNSQIKQIKDRKDKAELNIILWDKKIKELQAKLSDLTKIALEKRVERLAAINEEINSVTNDRMKREDELNEKSSDVQRKIDNRKKEKNSAIKEKRKYYDQACEKLDKEMHIAAEKHKAQVISINEEKLKALGSQGIDTQAVSNIQSQIDKAKSELYFIEQNNDIVVEYKKDKRELFDNLPEYKASKQKAENDLSIENDKFKIEQQKINSLVADLNNNIEKTKNTLNNIKSNIEEVENFRHTDVYAQIKNIEEEEACNADCHSLISSLHDNFNATERNMNRFKEVSRKFTGHFTAENIFGFKVELYTDDDFDSFADNLNDFIEDCRLDVFERETHSQFVNIINAFAKDMNVLLEKEGEIQKVISEINRDFDSKGKFALVIKLIELKRIDSERPIIVLLKKIRDFSDEHSAELGGLNLFSTGDTDKVNKQATEYLDSIFKEINSLKEKKVSLSDSFDLQFRIIENDNDSGFVSKLSNVGSDGTDVLVKAMINIMLLNVFKEKASKKSNQFKLHCMMDEIGKLHPNNIKGILDFANARNILLLNSSPTSYRAIDYKYTYLLSKDNNSNTSIKMLVNVSKNID